jgi:tRNA-2-methylthio-N6-dimethylallyladenosine synthase
MLKNVYIETYGCQMNIADSEIVASFLKKTDGYTLCKDIRTADIILINTCSIRENAEKKIWRRLEAIRHLKKKKKDLVIGLLGCMAERLKEQIIETDHFVDIVAGPDSYRDIVSMIKEADSGHRAVNVLLSREETYADISPVKLDSNGVTAFIPIMRGCNNMCAYCVVPYVRGAERSRDPESVVREARELFEKGYREITLLGQNVNSYNWKQENTIVNFAHLLEKTALIDPLLRVRYSTSHPKDLSDEVLLIMAKHKNICRHIHLPAQSGSNRILKLMNRGYTRELYMERIEAIRSILPDCAISTDMITGFCTETEKDHEASLSLMEWAEFDFSYMFRYSERPGTKAARKLKDDVPEDVKAKRLNEMIALQNILSAKSKKKDIGRIFEVLVEGYSKRSDNYLSGRTSQNKVAVFPVNGIKAGEYTSVLAEKCTSATLITRVV